MNLIRNFTIAALTLACVTFTSAAVPKLEGKWYGHIQVDPKKMPKPKTEAQKKLNASYLASVKRTKMELELKPLARFSFLMTSTENKGRILVEGKWSRKGTQLSLIGDRVNGIVAKGKVPAVLLTVSKDGKKLVQSQKPVGANSRGTLIYTRTRPKP